jgi:hypothetical protein
MIQYTCEGCGAEVFNVSRDTIPASQLCAVCEWLCEFVHDPAAFWAIYALNVRTKPDPDKARRAGA